MNTPSTPQSLGSESLGSVIAVDFDGTCVTHEYPQVGREIGASHVLRVLVEQGHKLVLFTMRSSDRPDGTDPLKDAIAWFERHGIPLHGINHNPDQTTWTSSPKAYAHLYIDDAALGAPLKEHPSMSFRPFIDWHEVYKDLRHRGLVPKITWDLLKSIHEEASAPE